MKIKIISKYKDKELKKEIEEGTILEVSEERGNQLIDGRVGEIVKEVKQSKSKKNV